jgi:hypothetical protein
LHVLQDFARQDYEESIAIKTNTADTMNTILEDLRRAYHRNLCSDVLGVRSPEKGFSNADSSNEVSRLLAQGMAESIGGPFCANLPSAQRSGSKFALHTKDFLQQSFDLIRHLRPGAWTFSTSQGRGAITAYDQYEHLAQLQDLAAHHPEIRQILGGDYLITPDIMVGRNAVSDDEINRGVSAGVVVIPDGELARKTPLRAVNGSKPTLHASISCKWSIRSDRAQNTRTEALNLIRNRKGRTPLIIVVTAEPLPTRLMSIAIGTGDIDCAYHAALPELLASASALPANLGQYVHAELNDLMSSRRLRDISDLPFDLAL